MLCTAIKSEFCSDLKIIEPGDGRSCNTTVNARLFDHDRPTVRVKSFLEGGTETTGTPIWQHKELGAWQIQFVLDIRILCEQRLDELSLADSAVRPKIRRDACEHDSDNQEPSTVSSRFHSDSQLDSIRNLQQGSIPLQRSCQAGFLLLLLAEVTLVHSRSAQAFSFDHAWIERVHTDLARTNLLVRHHSGNAQTAETSSFLLDDSTTIATSDSPASAPRLISILW